MIESGKHYISDITVHDFKAVSHHTYEDDEQWRIEFIKYLLEQRETSTLDEGQWEALEEKAHCLTEFIN